MSSNSTKEVSPNDAWILAFSDVYLGHCIDGNNIPFHEGLRKNIKNEVIPMMIYLIAAVALFLFLYLVAALVRPEWF